MIYAKLNTASQSPPTIFYCPESGVTIIADQIKPLEPTRYVLLAISEGTIVEVSEKEYEKSKAAKQQ